MADLPDRSAVSGYAREFYDRQTENTLQRVDIRHLLAEHGSQCRGGSSACDTLRARCDYSWHQLSATTAKFSDRPEEAGRTGWSER